MLLFGYSIAGDRSGPNCAPSCTTSSDWTNVRPRDTWPLPGRWDTAHNTAHARTPKKKKIPFLLFIVYSRWSGKYGIDQSHLPFFMLAGLPLCVWISRERRTHIFTRVSRERERERERQCEPKGTTMWNKNFIIGETNQRTWKTNWSLPMSTGFFFLFHRVPRAVCVHRWCIYLVNDAMPDGNPGSLCFSLAYSRNLFSMYINNIDTQHIHCPVHIYPPKADGHTKGRRPVEKEFTFALKKKIFFIFYFLFSCRLRKW